LVRPSRQATHRAEDETRGAKNPDAVVRSAPTPNGITTR
jgi:hypothetical protein